MYCEFWLSPKLERQRRDSAFNKTTFYSTYCTGVCVLHLSKTNQQTFYQWSLHVNWSLRHTHYNLWTLQGIVRIIIFTDVWCSVTDRFASSSCTCPESTMSISAITSHGKVDKNEENIIILKRLQAFSIHLSIYLSTYLLIDRPLIYSTDLLGRIQQVNSLETTGMLILLTLWIFA